MKIFVSKHRKKIISAGLALAMALALIISPIGGSYSEAHATNQINVTVDGHLVMFPDQRPVMVGNRVLVPVRGVFERMGFNVSWDGVNRIARLERAGILIIIPADLSSFVVNSQIVTPDVAQRITNNRLMLPLRYIAESAGGSAVWDEVNRVAIISTQASPTPTPVPTVTPTPTPTPTPTSPPHATVAIVFNPAPGQLPGGVAATQYHPRGSTLQTLPTPTRDGYNFAGWEQDGNMVSAPLVLNTNMNLQATWTPTTSSPTPTPEATPTPVPTPRPPANILANLRPFDQNHRHNIRWATVNVQGTNRGNALARYAGTVGGVQLNEQRESDSWIDIDLRGLYGDRLTGYVGRTGAATVVQDAATRRATIYGDGQVLEYFDVDGSFQLRRFDIDVSEVDILRVHFQAIGPVEERGVSLTVIDLFLHWDDE